LNGNESAFETLAYQGADHQFVIGTAEKMRIDASGNVGIGTVPSAWVSSFTALQVENASLWSTGSDASLTANAYYDGSNYKYIASSGASRQYHNTDGSIIWSQASSGTAGNNITFAERMRIDASGDVTVPGKILVNTDIRLGSEGVRLSSDGNGEFGIGYGQTATNSRFTVYNNTAVAFRVLPNGNVGIGNTNPQHKLHFGEAGSYYTSIGGANTAPGGAAPWLGVFNNNSIASATFGWGIYDSNVDGSFQIWNRAGNTTGAVALTIQRGGNVGIGTISPASNLEIFDATGGAGTGLRLNCNNGGSDVWDLYSTTAGRIYVTNPNYSGGVYLQHSATSWTGNSDERLKENIVELDNVLPKISNLRAVKYNFISDEEDTTKIGFIAQDWQTDFSEVVNDIIPEELGMNYTETIPVLLKAIQELKTELDAAKARIETLEG
jgi:hypothetical protein